jgi:hypothetical protein
MDAYYGIDVVGMAGGQPEENEAGISVSITYTNVVQTNIERAWGKDGDHWIIRIVSASC